MTIIDCLQTASNVQKLIESQTSWRVLSVLLVWITLGAETLNKNQKMNNASNKTIALWFFAFSRNSVSFRHNHGLVAQSCLARVFDVAGDILPSMAIDYEASGGCLRPRQHLERQTTCG